MLRSLIGFSFDRLHTFITQSPITWAHAIIKQATDCYYSPSVIDSPKPISY